MVATARQPAPVRRRQSEIPPTPDLVTGASERWFWYLHLIRAGRYERHFRQCAHCQPGGELQLKYGICPVGLRLAQGADNAMDAAVKLRNASPLTPASAGTLW